MSVKYAREATAAVLIPAVLAILIFGPAWGFSLLAGAAAAVALLEFYGLIEAAGWVVPRWVGLAFLLALLFAADRASLPLFLAVAGGVLLALPTLVMFARPPERVLLPSSAASVFATLYVAAGAAAMIGLRALSWKIVLVLFAIVWAGDSAAYYVGRKWGKKKLAPTVSPKKTWAGLYGQLAGGALFGLLAVVALGNAPKALLWGALGAGLSVVAVIGDLLESTFKRSCAVKDSGGLLPGHGGLLDRLDSLLYAAPVVLLISVLAPSSVPR